MFLGFDVANARYRQQVQELQTFAATRRVNFALRTKMMLFFKAQVT